MSLETYSLIRMRKEEDEEKKGKIYFEPGGTRDFVSDKISNRPRRELRQPKIIKAQLLWLPATPSGMAPGEAG